MNRSFHPTFENLERREVFAAAPLAALAADGPVPGPATALYSHSDQVNGQLGAQALTINLADGSVRMLREALPPQTAPAVTHDAEFEGWSRTAQNTPTQPNIVSSAEYYSLSQHSSSSREATDAYFTELGAVNERFQGGNRSQIIAILIGL